MPQKWAGRRFLYCLLFSARIAANAFNDCAVDPQGADILLARRCDSACSTAARNAAISDPQHSAYTASATTPTALEQQPTEHAAHACALSPPTRRRTLGARKRRRTTTPSNSQAAQHCSHSLSCLQRALLLLLAAATAPAAVRVSASAPAREALPACGLLPLTGRPSRGSWTWRRRCRARP